MNRYFRLMLSWAALAVVAFAQETDTRKILVAFGDSISAGYGVSREQSYPAQLQKKIDMAGLKWRVVNMGISGDTTQGGVSRMGSAIKRMPSIVLIELGGNDGLRGMPVSVSKANIEKLIKGFQEIGAQVVLAGMSLPPNYGPKYISDFEAAKLWLCDSTRKLGQIVSEACRWHARHVAGKSKRAASPSRAASSGGRYGRGRSVRRPMLRPQMPATRERRTTRAERSQSVRLEFPNLYFSKQNALRILCSQKMSSPF